MNSDEDWAALRECGKITVLFGLDRWMSESRLQSLYRDDEGWLRAQFLDGTEWGPVHRDDMTTLGWISQTIEED